MHYKYIHIVMITESWLSSDIPTSAITLNAKNITHRNDQRNRQAKGAAAYINNDLKLKRLLNLKDAEKEVLWLVLFIFSSYFPRESHGQENLAASVYYPPGRPVAKKKDMANYLPVIHPWRRCSMKLHQLYPVGCRFQLMRPWEFMQKI